MGLIGSIYLLGCAVGALVFSFFSLRLGRKKLFSITLMIYLVSTVLFSMSFCLEWMLLMRFLTGFGIGGEYTAIFSAVDEMIPPQYRGRVDLILDGLWHLGSLISYLTTIIFYSTNNSPFIWRVMFAVGALGAIPIIFLRKKIPESPRWLIYRKRYGQAQEIINQIIATNIKVP